MDINKNSWHYQFVDSVFKNVSRSLCVYFWQVVWSIIVNTTAAILSIAVFLCMLGLSLFFLSVPFFTTDPLASILSFVIWAYLLFNMKGLLTDMLTRSNPDSVFLKEIKLFNKPEKSLTKNKEPNIITEYVNAKKAKICPTLNFVDKE